ncbi:hypothetical protein [Qipengyuania nanhaisediminis]|uniref:EpsG family protein n=1 Tax=Qipengyuania nanhaisediminis TaxID=604088 RepID=A0A1I5QCR5_9SPHN|nr:hypothetical protein [Qipengyuania nanhaisediminis]SFP43770.1 hypothetical protein SAMN04488060_2858 [Qipengyuania nanhaisediminis]
MLIRKSKIYASLATILVIPYVFIVTQVVFLRKIQSDRGDIAGYIANYDRYVEYISYTTRSWIDYITNETIFHYIYFELSQYLADPEFALQVLAGLSSAVLILAVFPRDKSNIVFLILLLHPRVLDLMSSQIRFAVAISMFIVVLMAIQNRMRGLFALPISTIHTFFLAAGLFTAFFDHYLYKRRIIHAYAIALSIALVLVFGAELFLSYIGDRRSELNDGAKSFGLAYLVMTLFTYLTIIHQNKKMVYNVFGFLCIVSGASAIFTAIIDGYAERYVSSFIVFFLAYASQVKIQNTIFVFPVVMLNLLLSLYFWI